MNRLRIQTATEQVTDYLRQELLKGTWSENMPGAGRLASGLGVGIHTVAEALKQLEREGLLGGKGHRHRRRIVLTGEVSTPSLRITMLLYERDDVKLDYIVELQHRLLEAGHRVSFASKSLVDMKMDLGRVAKFVGKAKTDAWVVGSASREVLEWFSDQPVPAFALAGRRRGIRIAGAGADKGPAVQVAIRRLAELGHRRIVMIGRGERRKPVPGLMERTFLHEIELLGISSGSYNLPDWEESAEGLQNCLHELFRLTPPSAIFVDEVSLFLTVERNLAHLGFLAPRNVSLVCIDPSPLFKWFRPSVAHINWDDRVFVRRVVRWAHNVARGKDDRLQTLTKAEFVEGGTIGPAI